MGQCGDPANKDVIVAKPTIVPGSRSYVQVSVGGKHNCVVDNAGQIWCWGEWHACVHAHRPPCPLRV